MVSLKIYLLDFFPIICHKLQETHSNFDRGKNQFLLAHRNQAETSKIQHLIPYFLCFIT